MHFTSLDLPAADIERLGWRLLGRTEGELAQLYGIPRTGVPALLAKLRVRREPSFGAGELVSISAAAIGRAEAAMPRLFLRPVPGPVKVVPMPEQMQASGSAGFYRHARDGSPAAFVINLSRPQDRRLMAEVIAFHEALPGHHSQVILALAPGTFNSGFAEGWALYAEYLADEMGLYSGRLDRAGMMAKHLWAASRLVVEPGLHLHGWSRNQAIGFMRAHTALSDAEIAVEVDRYIATPGQSLSYMLGYDTIARARQYAEGKLGRRFDLRRFHEVVLSRGARPLGKVYSDVVRWADAGGGSKV